MIQGLVNWFKDSLILKAFLVLLMISFGVWGVGDFMTPGMDPNLAIQAGKTDVTLSDLQRRYEQDLERFKQLTGNKRIDSPEIKRAVLNQTVQDITYTATADAYGQDVGLVITTERLRDAVRDQ